ncbi:hypothetical protein ALC60_04047 [Trachymyrmex zeteki]|uniref:Uncharacterized protein n=1 Tax=Mycetomoellerius zeteki TaxID=64791 RepID=A0A151X9R2_9HYME|nr:hypothetical protein ALC60_04047 [Trachymyrmex zeteki]
MQQTTKKAYDNNLCYWSTLDARGDDRKVTTAATAGTAVAADSAARAVVDEGGDGGGDGGGGVGGSGGGFTGWSVGVLVGRAIGRLVVRGHGSVASPTPRESCALSTHSRSYILLLLSYPHTAHALRV